MITAKLFKNGNSVVLAIPEQARADLGWNAGDEIQLSALHLPDHTNTTIIMAAKVYIPHQPKPNHVRQTTRKPR